MSSPPDLVACPGCGLKLPNVDGPTPAHLGASPACWALYGHLLVRQYSEISDSRIHRLTIATYAVQHHPVRDRGPQASTTVELVVLCLLLERGASAGQTTTLLAAMLERPQAFRWLEPPIPSGTINVAEVLAARTPNEHAQLVLRWATNVWSAWAPHHAQVRRWIEGSPPADQT